MARVWCSSSQSSVADRLSWVMHRCDLIRHMWASLAEDVKTLFDGLKGFNTRAAPLQTTSSTRGYIPGYCQLGPKICAKSRRRKTLYCRSTSQHHQGSKSPSGKCSHRIIARQVHRLARFVNLNQLRWSQLLRADNLEDVLLEPSGSHDKVAWMTLLSALCERSVEAGLTLGTGRIGPAVLDAVTDGISLLINMNGRKNHRMGHCRFA